MKKNRIIFVTLILFSINSFAQSPKVINKAWDELKKYEALKKSLGEQCETLETKLTELESAITDLSERESNSNNEEKDKLVSKIKEIRSLEDFHQKNQSLKHELEKYSTEQWAHAYITMLEMNESRYEGYSDEDNKRHVQLLNIVQEGIFPVHKGLFKQLSEGIKDYNFIMSELLRVFDLVDAAYQPNSGITYQSLFKKLDDDHETDYIKEVPWAYIQLRDYITLKTRRKGVGTQSIRNDIIGRCPDAK